MPKEPDFFHKDVTDARRFYLDLGSRDSAEMTVVSGGWEVCAPTYRVLRSGFPWVGLELVVDGEGELELAGRRVALVPGSVFVYGPGIAHSIASSLRHPLSKYFLDLGGRQTQRLLAKHGLAPGSVHRLPLPARVRTMLDLVIEVGGESGPSAPQVCAGLAGAIVHALAASVMSPGCTEEPAYATYVQCRTWIEQHGETARDLGEVARRCAVSPEWICRLFKRYDRSSPWQLIRHRRLQRASEVLASSARPVAAVALEAGYSDAFHFSRAFRTRFGVSPLRFRKLARGR